MELRARGAQSETLTGSARNAELVWVPCKAMSKYCEAWRWCSREAVPSVDDTGSDLRRDCLQPDIVSSTRASRGRAILESIEPLNHSRMDDAFEGTIPLQPHVACMVKLPIHRCTSRAVSGSSLNMEDSFF